MKIYPKHKSSLDHLMDQVIEHSIQGVRTKGALKETYEYAVFISQIKSKNFKEAKLEESWINTMQEELGQFERNKG